MNINDYVCNVVNDFDKLNSSKEIKNIVGSFSVEW